MGTCCKACLAAKVREYALNSENGAVTVTLVKNPPEPETEGILISMPRLSEYLLWLKSLPRCDVCWVQRAEFAVSFFPKKE